MGWDRANFGQNGFGFGEWIRGIGMYLLLFAQGRAGGGRGSLQKRMYCLLRRRSEIRSEIG
jgi:hypothetical protein